MWFNEKEPTNGNKKTFIRQTVMPYILSLNVSMQEKLASFKQYIDQTVEYINDLIDTLKRSIKSDMDKMKKDLDKSLNDNKAYVDNKVSRLEKEVDGTLKHHVENHSNPHRVTCAQLGAADKKMYQQVINEIAELKQTLYAPTTLILQGIQRYLHESDGKVTYTFQVPPTLNGRVTAKSITVPWKIEWYDNGGSGWDGRPAYLDMWVDVGDGEIYHRAFYIDYAGTRREKREGTAKFYINRKVRNTIRLSIQSVAVDDDEGSYGGFTGDATIDLEPYGGGSLSKTITLHT